MWWIDVYTQKAPCVIHIPSSNDTLFVKDNLLPCELSHLIITNTMCSLLSSFGVGCSDV